jgi:ABC-type phosphate transport system substrate-binding protein
VPVDNDAIHAEFLAKVLQTDPRKYAARWTRKSFREGLVAPTMKGSDAEVMVFVKSTPGAIGYLSGTAKAGVKVLEKF